jgi:hypothetical protein
VKAPHLTALSSCAFCTHPPRCVLGSPINSSFNAKHLPSSFRSACSTFSLTTSESLEPSLCSVGLIHASGSAPRHEAKPRWRMHERRWFLKSFPADLPPQSARQIRATFPTFPIPNSGPHRMQSFWELRACQRQKGPDHSGRSA